MAKGRSASTSTAQKTQSELVEKALKQPGVAEATAVYEGARRFVPPPAALQPLGRIYGTGGNAR